MTTTAIATLACFGMTLVTFITFGLASIYSDPANRFDDRRKKEE